MEMNKHLNIDEEKIEKITDIKLKYLKGEIDLEQAKSEMRESVDFVTAQEFALCEQKLQEHGITDDELAERIDEILEIFEEVLTVEKPDFPKGHPLKTYMDEVKAIRSLLSEMESLKKEKFILNKWMELYEKLSQINVHFARKQNQLYPALENKGFDKPSKVMWTLENDIKDAIKEAIHYLETEDKESFLNVHDKVVELVEDMMKKEEEILYPIALELVTDEEFIKMRKGDDEIGYCLIDTPPLYKSEKENLEENKVIDDLEPERELLKDLSNLMVKYGFADSEDEKEALDVSQGKLTLEQINLMFKHLPVDLTFVDENEMVKFYSDTKHRVFPRSPGVIGREVKNCHPRESVDTVEKIIKAFKSGQQDEAEFWLEMNGKFVYILYTAVKDENGKFKGVLEFMQDATRIRSLEGSQRLLTWEDKKSENEEAEEIFENSYGITSDTVLGELVEQYPFIKEFLLNLSPSYNKLRDPALFKSMSDVATLEMISERGNFKVSELIEKIVEKIKSEETK